MEICAALAVPVPIVFLRRVESVGKSIASGAAVLFVLLVIASFVPYLDYFIFTPFCWEITIFASLPVEATFAGFLVGNVAALILNEKAK